MSFVPSLVSIISLTEETAFLNEIWKRLTENNKTARLGVEKADVSAAV